jgi:hypothetical protein
MTIIRHASANRGYVFSQQPINRIIRRTPTRSKSSSLPLDEARLLLADEPNANLQTDRSYYLNECVDLESTIENLSVMRQELSAHPAKVHATSTIMVCKVNLAVDR